MQTAIATPEDPRAGTYKTGQRVPITGWYVDQYGRTTFHEKYRTFPPCLDRKGECAFRRLTQAAK